MSSLISLVLALFLAAPVVYLLGRGMGSKVSWIVALLFLGAAATQWLMFPEVMHQPHVEEYQWVSPPLGLSFGLLADGLSTPMVFTFLFVCAAASLFSGPYMERRLSLGDLDEGGDQLPRFYSLFLLYGASVAGCMLATDTIQFFMFFELALIFSWLLVFLYGYGDRRRNSMVYFIYTHIGGGIFLLGILGAYWSVGSFKVADLAQIAGHPQATLVGLAITIGLLFKIGAFGFHGWMPITYAESPAPLSAVLGATSVMLSTYGMARLLPYFQEALEPVSHIFMAWALVTILYAGAMALAQRDTKKLVAYLSMSQMNYCVLGVFTYVAYGVLGSISYSISHGLAIGLLFLVSGALLYRTGSRDMDEMGGLAERLPSVILASLAGFLTIGGVPPAVGFKSKFILLSGAMVRGLHSGWLELMVAILAGSLATLLTLGYEFRAVWRIFYGKLPKRLEDVKAVPLEMALPLLALGALAVVFGVWPKLITNPIEVFIEHIFHH